MTIQHTAVAPSNIAFVKYWGTSERDPALPANRSISMTLSRCTTRTTVAHDPSAHGDVVERAGDSGVLEPAPAAFRKRVVALLDGIRRAAGAAGAFRVATANSFPSDAGIASSASGFAALAVAAASAVALDTSPAMLSVLARGGGSGSAARSLLGGYVAWPDPDDRLAPAYPVAPASHWDLRDVVAIVDTRPKDVSSREGHRRARTSRFFAARQAMLPERLDRVRDAILARDLAKLGPEIEAEAIDLHVVAMTSAPPIHYWRPATLEVLEAVRALRDAGVAAFATLDAGPNVHVICEPVDVEVVARRLESLPSVLDTIRDGVGVGPRLVDDHLF